MGTEEKSNNIALAALAISIFGILWHLEAYIMGSKVTLIPPEQITLVVHTYEEGGDKYLSIITTMAYANSGKAGYNDVIKKEKVAFEIKGKQYEFMWQYFVSTSSERNSNRMVFNYKDNALPFTLNAGSAESHETYFFPHHSRHFGGNTSAISQNYLKLDTFIKAFEPLILSGQSVDKMKLKFKFIAETMNDNNKEIERVIYLSQEDISRLRNPNLKKAWTSPNCWPVTGVTSESTCHM